MWIIFSFLAAFASATRSAISKNAVSKNSEYGANLALWFFGLPILLIVLYFLGLPQQITSLFWIVLLINIFLNVIASIFFMRSLKLAPLSLIAPILALTPVFVVVASSIMLREVPSFIGFIGIFLAVIGAYLLNANRAHSGMLKPIAELFRNKGSRYGLSTAALFGITSTIDKVAVSNSSPTFYLICISIGVSLIFAILLKKKGVNNFGLAKNNWIMFLALGTAYASMLIFQMFAIQSAFVAYALSIKRVDALLGVIYGYFFFKETNIKERLLGAIIMVISLILIAIA